MPRSRSRRRSRRRSRSRFGMAKPKVVKRGDMLSMIMINQEYLMKIILFLNEMAKQLKLAKQRDILALHRLAEIHTATLGDI
jgi:hypothetical protein